MSEGPLASPASAPPPKSGGSRTVIIVIVVLLLLIAICCGGCLIGGVFVGGKAVGLFTEPVVSRIRLNEEVKEKLGEPLTAGLPSMQNNNGQIAIEFPITGPKGSAQVRAQLTEGPNGPEPTSIQVTPTGGSPIEVSTETSDTEIDIPVPSY